MNVSKNLDHLALNITRRCNQRCIFCFEGDRKGWEELSQEKIAELVVKSIKRKVDRLIFMGAEAFLRRDIVEIIRMCKDLGMKQVGVFTNGKALLRENFIEKLVESGLDFLDISFHYSNSDTFSKCTRTPPKFFDHFIAALKKLDKYNRDNRKKLRVITKSLMFSQNQGDLKKIFQLINTIFSNTYVINGIKRIQFSTYVPGDIYLLDNIYERREEIRSLSLDTSRLYFTRVPLCMIPEKEHLSVDLQYFLNSSIVLSNFDDKQKLGFMHNRINDFLEDPFKDVCIRCSFLGLCPMGSSSFENKAFYPYESQRPIPSRKDVKRIINKIANGTTEIERIYKNYILIKEKLKEIYHERKKY